MTEYNLCNADASRSFFFKKKKKQDRDLKEKKKERKKVMIHDNEQCEARIPVGGK